MMIPKGAGVADQICVVFVGAPATHPPPQELFHASYFGSFEVLQCYWPVYYNSRVFYNITVLVRLLPNFPFKNSTVFTSSDSSDIFFISISSNSYMENPTIHPGTRGG